MVVLIFGTNILFKSNVKRLQLPLFFYFNFDWLHFPPSVSRLFYGMCYNWYDITYITDMISTIIRFIRKRPHSEHNSQSFSEAPWLKLCTPEGGALECGFGFNVAVVILVHFCFHRKRRSQTQGRPKMIWRYATPPKFPIWLLWGSGYQTQDTPFLSLSQCYDWSQTKRT